MCISKKTKIENERERELNSSMTIYIIKVKVERKLNWIRMVVLFYNTRVLFSSSFYSFFFLGELMLCKRIKV